MVCVWGAGHVFHPVEHVFYAFIENMINLKLLSGMLNCPRAVLGGVNEACAAQGRGLLPQ